MTDLQEAPGLPPAYILDPRIKDDIDENGNPRGPAVTARFYMGPETRLDPVGNTIVDDKGEVPIREWVEIINRNDPKNSPMINISTDIHRFKMYPREYAAFRQGLDQEATGIPVREWLGDNDRTRNLGHFHIHTVEQLASISDSLCQTLGPGTYDLRKKALAYLAIRKDSALAERVMAESASQKTEIAELKAMVARLSTAVNSSQAKAGAEQEVEEHYAEIDPTLQPQKRKPGRPARIQEGL